MNTYKRHRFPHLGGPPNHQLCRLALLSIQPQARGNRRVVTVTAGMPDQKINGSQHYLWRAVDQDGEVVDVYLQARRDGAAAKRFFKRLLRSHGGEPRKIVTDKLRSYGVAH